MTFGESLHRLRMEKKMSRYQLGSMLHVDQSTVARWENGTRLPNINILPQLSECLGTDVTRFLQDSARDTETPNVILLNNDSYCIYDEITVLREALPEAEVHGYSAISDALDFSKLNRVYLAFVKIEMGENSGLDVCQSLLKIDPHINVILLSASQQNALDAWKTGASGFLLTPFDAEAVRNQLTRLHWPAN